MERARKGLVRVVMFLTTGGVVFNGSCGGCDEGIFASYGGGSVGETLRLVSRIVGIWA